MAECWSCAHPAPGLHVVSPGDPVGVCHKCNSLTCDQHGAVDTTVNQFRCAACYPAVVLLSRAGSPAPPGPGGGPLVWPVDTDVTLTWHAPELVAASRQHTEGVRHISRLAAFIGDQRWRRMTGEPLDVDLSVATMLLGFSLFAAGLEPGELPAYQPGEEGPLLRRNPLVAGWLHARILPSLHDALEATLQGEPVPAVDASRMDEELHRQLDAELNTLSNLPPPPRRVVYRAGQEGENGQERQA